MVRTCMENHRLFMGTFQKEEKEVVGKRYYHKHDTAVTLTQIACCTVTAQVVIRLHWHEAGKGREIQLDLMIGCHC